MFIINNKNEKIFCNTKTNLQSTKYLFSTKILLFFLQTFQFRLVILGEIINMQYLSGSITGNMFSSNIFLPLFVKNMAGSQSQIITKRDSAHEHNSLPICDERPSRPA